MGGNSGDNMDLIGAIPGESGTLPDSPGFEIEDNGALMARIKTFYDEGVGAWEENRRMHSEDLNFAYNSEAQGQWDPVVLQNRRGKPCYTFNRVLQPINMVVADMRQTRPAGKVRPASDGASEPVADIFGGVCRSIEQCSRAEVIYKEQFKYAVAGGFGAWRITPDVHDRRRRRRLRPGAAPRQHLEPADGCVGPAVRGPVRRRRQPLHHSGARCGRSVRRRCTRTATA